MGARSIVALVAGLAALLASAGGAGASVQSNVAIARTIKADIAKIIAGINAHDVARATQFDADDIVSMESGRPPSACAVQRRRFPVGASPTRQMLQPEAIGADREVTNWLKPSMIVSRIGDRASVQAAT
jgi:hypothetical protein